LIVFDLSLKMCYNRLLPKQVIAYQDLEQEHATMDELSEARSEGTPNTKPKTGGNTGRTIGIVAAVVVVLALIGAAGYGLATHPDFTSVLRDISIIVLALVTIVIGLFLVVLIFQLQSLIALLRDEIKPILDSTNETVSTVRGTTTFVSDALVQPMITVVSYGSAVRRTISTLFGGGHKKNRTQHQGSKRA
jgi:tetrahydromethanopterin S-methyltransferase subunit G